MKTKPTNANALAKDHVQRASGGLPGGLSDSFELETMIAKSIISIDKFFGEGFAQKNPSLVAASISAAARLESSRLGNIEDALNNVCNGLGELADACRQARRHPKS